MVGLERLADTLLAQVRLMFLSRGFAARVSDPKYESLLARLCLLHRKSFFQAQKFSEAPTRSLAHDLPGTSR